MDFKFVQDHYPGVCPIYKKDADITVFRRAMRQTPSDLQLVATYSGAKCNIKPKHSICDYETCNLLPKDFKEPVII